MAARPGGEGDGAPPRPLPAPASDFVLQPGGLAYLNVATLGPVPRRVLEATHRDVLALQANPHVNYFLAAPGSVCERMDQVRAQVAGLLGCTQQEVFLFSCTTQALTAVAKGLLASGFLRAGDRVVTTDQEHAGALAGWRHLEATAGLRLSAVALGVPETRGEAAVVQAFRAELAREPRAKVLAVPHVLTTTGYTLPLAAIAAAAHGLGCAVVADGAQAGAILGALPGLAGADVYAAPGHKWLLGPTGSGFAAVRAHFRRAVAAPALADGPAAYTGATGTRAAFPTLGLGHALNYLAEFGIQRVHDHAVALAAEAWDALAAARFPMLAPRPACGAAPIVTFAIEGPAQGAADALLHRHGMVVKATGAAAFPEEWPPGSPAAALRLTFHLLNSADDVVRVAAAVAAECRPPQGDIFWSPTTAARDDSTRSKEQGTEGTVLSNETPGASAGAVTLKREPAKDEEKEGAMLLDDTTVASVVALAWEARCAAWAPRLQRRPASQWGRWPVAAMLGAAALVAAALAQLAVARWACG